MATNNSCNYSPTQFNTQTGGANGSLNNVAPGTAGQVLTSNGASAQPTFQSFGGGSGAAKAWGTFSIDNAGNPTLLNGFNVTSVTGPFGTYTVTLTTPMSNTVYVALANGGKSGQNNVVACSISSASQFVIASGSNLATRIFFAVFGT